MDLKTDPLSTISSPLKRSDAIMNPDDRNIGSPVAKRRSLHGISSLGSEFNVFDHGPAAQQSFEIHDESSQEYQLTGAKPTAHAEILPPPTPASNVMAKRTTSLRKSTLQQRHDPRSSWGRRQGEKYLAQQGGEVSSPAAPRTRARASLDQFLPPEPRESPFTVKGAGPLPNPSAHIFDRTQHQPHPLSRTLTTSSSSGSSVPDDSPTHFPFQQPDRPRPASIFARTLPAGANRPIESIATPSYKNAKPLQAAFASTGLISKMNRNPEDEFSQVGGRRPIMPDTPCKKQVYPSNTYPPSSGSGRKQNRFLFAAPATPGLSRQPSGIFGDGETKGGLFQFRTQHGRKNSLLSLDDSMDFQNLADGDLPPTPTKPVLARKFATAGHIQSTPVAVRTKSPSFSAIGFGMERPTVDLSCKSRLPIMSSTSVELSNPVDTTTSSPILHTPTPIKPTTVSFLHVNDCEVARLSSTNFTKSASPLAGVLPRQPSPKTPQDFSAELAAAPLDASNLSISSSQEVPGMHKRLLFQPPATPTAGREASFFASHRESTTPMHRTAPKADEFALRSRFDTVQGIGKGEFSNVFRVSSSSNTTIPSSPMPLFANSSQSDGPADERVFAVKKIAFQGPKDLALKLAEITALKAVRGKENVVQLLSYWEEDHHLYIQTEYCEEGSLDNFLKKVGDTGRLDD